MAKDQHPDRYGRPARPINPSGRLPEDEVTALVERAWTSDYTLPGFPGAVRLHFRPDHAGRAVLAGLILITDEGAVTADMLRRIPVAQIEDTANRTVEEDNRRMLESLPPLVRDGVDPVAFSERVASHYRLWAAATRNPAARMAEAAGVKLPTVHSWIREARLRGFLPPARRGKA